MYLTKEQKWSLGMGTPRPPLTGTQEWIVDYLKMYPGDWVSPSSIGREYGRRMGLSGVGYHSAWASPRCLGLVSLGLIQRSGKGWYRYES